MKHCIVNRKIKKRKSGLRKKCHPLLHWLSLLKKMGMWDLIFLLFCITLPAQWNGCFPFPTQLHFSERYSVLKYSPTQELNHTAEVSSSPWPSITPVPEQLPGVPLERAVAFHASWGWCQECWMECSLQKNSKLRTKCNNNKELKCADQRTSLNPSLLKGHVIFRKLSKQLS